MTESKKIGVTEVVLRDGHQSLLATRFKRWASVIISN